VEQSWAVVVPMANEEQDFAPFQRELAGVLDRLGCGTVYFIVDRASKDATLQICQECGRKDARFVTIWAPENRHLVDAYVRGYKEALDRGHKIILEMDAGLSHDPNAIPMFLRVLSEGNECAFGSRYINGGSNTGSPLRRRFLSKAGTILAWVFLGAKLKDMTSGFQGFQAHVARKLVGATFHSTAHFYQTEVRYLLRQHRTIEVPIHYRAPSPRVSRGAILNAWKALLHYAGLRCAGRAPSL
jgi:dolichol-phosphate mannosyltransferase